MYFSTFQLVLHFWTTPRLFLEENRTDTQVFTRNSRHTANVLCKNGHRIWLSVFFVVGVAVRLLQPIQQMALTSSHLHRTGFRNAA